MPLSIAEKEWSSQYLGVNLTKCTGLVWWNYTMQIKEFEEDQISGETYCDHGSEDPM